MRRKNFLQIILFLFSMFLVYYGQKKIGQYNLLIMLLGVVGILISLYMYNLDKK